MNKPSDEIVEVWQQEFERLVLRDFGDLLSLEMKVIMENPECRSYRCNSVNDMWLGFLMARETVVIELPLFQLMDDPDGCGRGEYVMCEVLECKIESQGYSVKRGE